MGLPVGLRARVTALVLIACSCLFLTSSVFAQDLDQPVVAPLNPAFVACTSAQVQGYARDFTEDGYPLGYVPGPIDLSHARGVHELRFQATSSPPPFYDMRTASPAKLTPMRNQMSCGSCWAFANYGSLESCLLPGQTFDFSENHLKNTHGFDWTCCYGGTHFVTTAYIARWSGPVLETSDGYNPSSCASPSVPPAVVHVQNVDYFPGRTGWSDNSALKQAVMNQGAVYVTVYWSSAYYSSTNSAYYCSYDQPCNHAVCIVGWDDNYDKSKFSSAPAGNGAFIVRNSWGSDWGEGGYFYVSYYDANFADESALFYSGEPVTNYDRCYQYDPLGWVSSLGFGTATGWFANVFTASGDEQLKAVSFYTAMPNSPYEIRVYLNPTSGPINSSGLALTQTGTMARMGYHTIALSSSVHLTASQKFSVVVKQTTPGYNYPVPIEYPVSNYSSQATSNAGESYISSAGSSWSDVRNTYASGNVCIKAFAEGDGLKVTPDAGFSSEGAVGGPFGPAGQVYTLKNTGAAAISWTATKTAPWLDVTPSSGALAGYSSTTVTASPNSFAATLPSGRYSDTVSFANTTNGRGNTTRSAALTATNNYVASPAVFAWVDPSAHTILSPGDDGVIYISKLAFPFDFCEKARGQVYVGSNGVLGFASDQMSSGANTDVPIVSTPNAVICPYWDDLNPASGGSVRYATVGTSPNRRLVISWVDVPIKASPGSRVTFQALLCESTNDIVFQYLDVDGADPVYGAGRGATVGVEDDTGTVGTRYCYNGSVLLRDKSAVLFSSRGPEVSQLKGLWDFEGVTISRALVTAAFGDAFYIESENRSCGIRVCKPSHGLVAGDRASVSGALGSTLDDERCINATWASKSGSGTPRPLLLTVRTLGGGPWHYDSLTGEGQCGVEWGCGLSNVGLLVRMVGRVSSPGSGEFYLDDGSTSYGRNPVPILVKAICPTGATLPSPGDMVSVTGISSCEKVGEVVRRVIRVRDGTDIVGY